MQSAKQKAEEWSMVGEGEKMSEKKFMRYGLVIKLCHNPETLI